MSSLALILILLAAFIHASWNFVAKKAGGDARFVLLTCIALAIVWAPLGFWFGWRDAGAFGLRQWGLIATSGAMHIFYFLVLLRGYRLGDLSVVYPLARGSGPLVTALVATSFMGESLRLCGWLGIAGIVAGIVLIAGGPALWHSLRAGAQASEEQQKLRAGIYYGLLTGVFIASYSVIDGYAVKKAGVSPVLVDYFGNLARLPLIALLLWFWSRKQKLNLFQYTRQYWKAACLVGVISPVSYVMVLYAATLAPLSQVAPAREISMLFAALFGGKLLGERDAGMRLLGAACIIAGVIALMQG